MPNGLPFAAQFGNPAVTYNQSFQDRNAIDSTQLMNPQWAKWLDTIQADAGDKSIRFAGGPSAPGSNQIRGTNVQPYGRTRQQPQPPQPRFIGAHGGPDGDMFAIDGNDYATTNPALRGLNSFAKGR